MENRCPLCTSKRAGLFYPGRDVLFLLPANLGLRGDLLYVIAAKGS